MTAREFAGGLIRWCRLRVLRKRDDGQASVNAPVPRSLLVRSPAYLKETDMRFSLLPALLLLIAAGDASTLKIDHPWARPSAGAATTGAAYLTITEEGAADRLVSVSTPVAGTAEVHETINDQGVMKMRPVDGLALVPGKPVTLSPGGYHVMLTGLKAPLKPGDSFPLTLTFEHAAPVTVTVKVETPPAGRMPMGGMNGMAH